MSGASSAFTNGHLVDRKASRGQDLDLYEILALCSKPLGIDERVKELQRYAKNYPEVKYFLIVAYFYKKEFSDIRDLGELKYIPSRVARGGSLETIGSMWKEVVKCYNSFPSGPKTKRGRAQELLRNLYHEDAQLLYSLFMGKFYMKELNEVVVSKAFPQEVPKDPKP